MKTTRARVAFALLPRDYAGLCRLIEEHEKDRVDASKVTVLEALRHFLDALVMSAADLARLLDVHRTVAGART